MVAALPIYLVNCGSHNEKNDESLLAVGVSIQPEIYFVEHIGGDSVTVECITPPGTNAETFEPGMSNLKSAASSDVFFTTGILPFEEKMLSNIKGDSDNGPEIVNLSKGLNLIYGTHNHEGFDHHDSEADSAEVKGMADPHIWSSIKNAKIIAENVFRGLSKARPSAEDYFRQRLNVFLDKLDSLDHSFASRLDNIDSKTFIVLHPSLSYFARDYGLKQVSIEENQKDSSIKGMKDAIDRAGGSSANYLFFPAEFDSEKARSIANNLELTPVKINPMGSDWQTQMELIMNVLDKNDDTDKSLCF